MSAPEGNDEFGDLPVDSDVGSATALSSRVRAGDLALVFAGGMVGTALRALITASLPSLAGIPLGTLIANLVGAFVLGFLLEALARTGPDTGWRRRARLLGGTGVLGGFTTYSAFALETITSDGSPVTGIVYALGSILAGAALALAGILAARAVRRSDSSSGARS